MLEDLGAPLPISHTSSGVQAYVGQPAFTSDRIYQDTPAGVVMGLAWTSMGGSSLYVEAAAIERGENKGRLITTGRISPPPISTI